REDDLRPLGDERVDRGDRGPDPRVVGDLAVRERYVEVDAYEDALARGVEVAYRQLVHFGWLVRGRRCRRPAGQALAGVAAGRGGGANPNTGATPAAQAPPLSDPL